MRTFTIICILLLTSITASHGSIQSVRATFDAQCTTDTDRQDKFGGEY